jgi:flagellar biosynthesis anti-sigma factor FlgM
MKIEGGIHPMAKPQGKGAASRSADKNAATRSSQEEGDAFSVELSPITEKLLSAAPAEEVINWEKITSIRDQLASGTYNISGKDVAAKILNALKE